MSTSSSSAVLQKTVRRQVGDIRPNAVAVVIYESVLEQIIEFSETDLARELGGFLVGVHHELPETMVEIRRFFPAAGARRGQTSVTFTHESWSPIVREIDEKFPGEAIVGWQHTHPNFGIFLSSYDLFIHQHFFDSPWQVALVVDPRRQEFGFFQWQAGQIIDCGFVCVED